MCAEISLGHHDANHLADRDRLARGDGQLGDAAGAMRVHFILHLPRLDDAEDLARHHLVALCNLDREHSALHRTHDRIAPCARGPAAAHSFATAPTQLGEGRLGTEDAHLEAASVYLDRADHLTHGGRPALRWPDRTPVLELTRARRQ